MHWPDAASTSFAYAGLDDSTLQLFQETIQISACSVIGNGGNCDQIFETLLVPARDHCGMTFSALQTGLPSRY